MKDETGGQRGGFGWALPASVALHLLIAALLVFELPLSLPQPQEEEAIAVDLVPPPQPPEDAEAEPPPAPEPAPEEPQEAEVTAPPPTSDGPQEILPSLRPVFQFGERDAGPRESPDGSSAEDGSAPPAPEAQEQELAEQPAEAPAEPSDSVAEAEAQANQPETPETPNPESAEATAGDRAEDGPASPDVLHDPQSDAAQSVAPASEGGSELPLPEIAERPMPRPVNTVEAGRGPELREARRLFSRSVIPDPVATTATGRLPRGVRGAQLCVTELREQLRSASPPHFPDLLPSYPLGDGTVLDVPRAAFRVSGQWFDLSFRCTVDTEVTKVVSFAFRVGDRIPRGEWARRGFPAQ